MPLHERPREKLNSHGAERLKDYELLAVLLGTGVRGLNVIKLSKKVAALLNRAGNKITPKDLAGLKGLGQTKAFQIIAAIELGKRCNEIRSMRFAVSDVWVACTDIRSSKKEHLVAFYLDSRNSIIERQIISVGTIDETLAHPREVFEPAIVLKAAGVLLAHNHPTGSIAPSSSDLLLTERMSSAAELLGIKLVDHVILTKGQYLSFRAQKLLS